MRFTNIEHSSIAVLSFFSLIVFLHLGAGEIQPWNEGWQAMRAKSIIEYGTNRNKPAIYLTDEIASRAYPPLNVAMITLSMRLFGENSFALRLFSAVCSAAALLLLYSLARRFVSNELSIASALLLVGTIDWNSYSRQGMSSIPMTALILASLIIVFKVKESDNTFITILWSFLFLAAIFLSFLTEPLIALLPVIFILSLFVENKKTKKIILLSAAYVIAAIASILWYYKLSGNNGVSFIGVIFNHAPLSKSETGEYYGIFSFLSKIITANPVFLLSLIITGIIIAKRKKITLLFGEADKYLVTALASWFTITLVIYAFIAEQYPHFIVFIIPPAVMLAVKMYSQIGVLVTSKRFLLVIISLLAASAIWSFLSTMRGKADDLLNNSGLLTISLLILIAAIVASLIIAALAPEKVLNRLSYMPLSRAWYLLLICIVIRVIIINSIYSPGNSFGAERTAAVISKINTNSFVYLFHQEKASDSLNPQLAWYTDGWIYGWKKSKSYTPVGLPKDGISFTKLRSLDTIPDEPVVYYIHDDPELARTVIKDVMETRPVLLISHNYIIFGKKYKERPKGITT